MVEESEKQMLLGNPPVAKPDPGLANKITFNDNKPNKGYIEMDD